MINWGLLVLRLGLGTVFAAHGLQKVFGLFGGPGIKGFSDFLSSLKFVPATFWAYTAAFAELLGGLCIILGFLTRPAAAVLFILITVAAVKVHIAKGFFLAQGGFEYTLLIACVCICLMLLGAGEFRIIK